MSTDGHRVEALQWMQFSDRVFELSFASNRMSILVRVASWNEGTCAQFVIDRDGPSAIVPVFLCPPLLSRMVRRSYTKTPSAGASSSKDGAQPPTLVEEQHTEDAGSCKPGRKNLQRWSKRCRRQSPNAFGAASECFRKKSNESSTSTGSRSSSG